MPPSPSSSHTTLTDFQGHFIKVFRSGHRGRYRGEVLSGTGASLYLTDPFSGRGARDLARADCERWVTITTEGKSSGTE